jgi:hypothetical protein
MHTSELRKQAEERARHLARSTGRMSRRARRRAASMGHEAAGVAELRGSIRERTRNLIDISHPKFRDDLERQAREIGFL